MMGGAGGYPEDPEVQLEDVEARFFLKEKLCQLGLMEVGSPFMISMLPFFINLITLFILFMCSV